MPPSKGPMNWPAIRYLIDIREKVRVHTEKPTYDAAENAMDLVRTEMIAMEIALKTIMEDSRGTIEKTDRAVKATDQHFAKMMNAVGKENLNDVLSCLMMWGLQNDLHDHGGRGVGDLLGAMAELNLEAIKAEDEAGTSSKSRKKRRNKKKGKKGKENVGEAEDGAEDGVDEKSAIAAVKSGDALTQS